MRVPIKSYLKRAKKIGVKPNFYLSETYLEIVGAVCEYMAGTFSIKEENMLLFPPIWDEGFDMSGFTKVWSDLGIVEPSMRYDFLDYEYIFNPRDFDHMEGGKWKVFRKNVRKWPRENPSWGYVDEKELGHGAPVSIYNTIIQWLNSKLDICQDADLLSDYAHFSKYPGIHRKYLLSGNKIVGINAWDENWEYINYRVCMVDKTQPFLDEFMRYCFYTDPDIRRRGKWVNDGGVLDNPDLEKFKDKLNPLIKKKIYSLRRK